MKMNERLPIVEKHKEELLKRSEERLALATLVGNLGLWDWNIETDEVFYNDIYFSMLGYSSEPFPFTTETWKILVYPEDQEFLFNSIQTALTQKNSSWRIEFRMKHASRGYRWIRCQGQVVEYSEKGLPLRAVGIHQDVTQQKRTEKELLENERKYRALFDNMSSGVVIHNVVDGGNEFIIEEVNRSFLQVTRKSREEILGRKNREVFPGLNETIYKTYAKVYEKGMAMDVKSFNYKDDLLNLWADVHIFKLFSGEIVSIFNDFTGRKKIEDALENEKKRFENIINLSNDLFFLLDEDGKVIYNNIKVEKITKYTSFELKKMDIKSILFNFQTGKIFSAKGLLNKGCVVTNIVNIIHKNGEMTPLEMQCKRMPDGTIQCFCRDITRRKKFESALLRQQKDLEEKQEQLKEMNTALKVLIRQSRQEKNELKENLTINFLGLIEPYFKQLKKTNLSGRQLGSIKVIEEILEDLTSPFMCSSTAMNLKLSPAEFKIANLIKQGMTSKEIAGELNCSPQTIDKHRSNIRKKIGVKNKGISLRDILLQNIK